MTIILLAVQMPLTLVEDFEPHGAALNMAVDEALLRAVERPLLRCYRWARPAASMGYFGLFRDLRNAWPEREWVRRWTGGGMVPHGEDFTYSLILPREHPLATAPLSESYRRIHEAVARAFELAGGCTPRLAEATSLPVSATCFENPALGDVLLGTRKVAGAAQRRTQGGMLHQGSVQLPGAAKDFLKTLVEVLEIRARRPLHPAELAAGEAIAAQRYATSEWLQRR